MQYAFSHYSQFQGINRLLEEAQRGLLFSLSNCTDDIPQIIKRIPQKEGVGQIVELLQLLDALTHLTPEKVISSKKSSPLLPTIRFQRGLTDERLKRSWPSSTSITPSQSAWRM